MRNVIRLGAALYLAFAGALPSAVAQPSVPGQFEELCAQVVRAMKAGNQGGAERLAAAAFDLAKDFPPRDRRRVNIRLLRGEVARHGGKAGAAEEWYREALAVAESTFGEYSPDVIDPLEALANLYSLTGQPKRAVRVDARLLAIAEHARPGDPLDLARRCRILAEAEVAAGDAAAAEPLFRRAADVADTFPSALDADQAEYLRALAEYLLHAQRLDEARTLAERALAKAEHRLGPADLGLCALLETAGDIRLAAHAPDAAAALFDRSCRIMEKVAGSASPDLARPLLRLAAAERARGRREEAEALCERAASVVTRGLGADAPELAPVLEERASLLDEAKQAAAASALRRQAAELRKHGRG